MEDKDYELDLTYDPYLAEIASTLATVQSGHLSVSREQFKHIKNKLSEKLAIQILPVKPSRPQAYWEEDCPFGRDFAFFWYRFIRVL